MLNHSVAPRECFSFFAEKMRWAMYPPPPGSAPGYQLAHQLRLSSTRKLRKNGDADDGINASVSRACPLTACVASKARTCAASGPIPPTAWTAKYASRMTMHILRTNCTRSVQSTAHRPETALYASVSARQQKTPVSCWRVVVRPSVRARIFAIARLTHPMMMVLTGKAR